MRKLNVSMDMFGNTKGKEKHKKKEKKKRSRKCYYEVFKSKLASKHMPCLLAYFFLYSFFLSFVFFVLEQVFILRYNGMKILKVGQSISSLAQWHNNPIYSGWYMGISYEVRLEKKIETEDNLEASLSVFWSQSWILLDVSIDSCLCKFVHMYMCFSISIYKQ